MVNVILKNDKYLAEFIENSEIFEMDTVILLLLGFIIDDPYGNLLDRYFIY